MKAPRHTTLRTLMFGATLAASVAVQAQSYPTKPVRIILPFGPGSATDVMTRVLADELRQIYNQPFVIDYKAGASGQIGAEAAAKSAPDGYTLFVGTNSTHSANPHLFKKLNYDPVKDFTPISHLVAYSSVLAAAPNAPYSNVRELIDYARANPGKVSYGYGNTIGQLGAATLFRTANVQVLGVAYKSNPLAVTDVLGGVVSVTIVDLASGQGMIKSGKLKPLAGVREKRSVLLPDLPTVSETPGFEGFGINSWVGFFGPAGLPRPLAENLSGATRKILSKPDIKAKFEATSAELEPSTPDEFRVFIARQLESWGKRVRDAGIQPE
jgi:tripartite-type tricarboxylate transporter receptor subunit TctC